jgi:hypothetical protein
MLIQAKNHYQLEQLASLQKHWRIIPLLILFCLFSGCHYPFPNGHYEGVFYHYADSKLITQPVSIDINSSHHSRWIAIQDISGNFISKWEVELKHNEISLWATSVREKPFLLRRSKNCYLDHSGHSNKEILASFCVKNDHFNLTIRNDEGRIEAALTGSLFVNEKPLIYEVPSTFDLSKLIRLALSSSFLSRIEIEKVLQAKKTALSGYLNLLPRLGVGTILSNIPIDPLSLVESVGDLAPFLLPTRWLKAKEGSILAAMEKTTQMLLQADLATQVEGLSYIFIRDRTLLQFQRNALQQLVEFYTQVSELEVNGKLEIGCQKSAQMIINAATLDLIGIEYVLKGDRYALSQAVGFNNPEAVQDVIFDQQEVPILESPLEDRQELAEIAVRRSFELKQIDEAIALSRNFKHELYFNWLDMQGDGNKKLGFALIPHFQVANSKINELKIQREQLRSIIAQKAHETADSLNRAIETYPLARKIFDDSWEHLHQLMQDSLERSRYDGESIRGKLDAASGHFVRAETILSTYRIARSKVDRMKLQGYYLELMPKYDEFSEAMSLAQEGKFSPLIYNRN